MTNNYQMPSLSPAAALNKVFESTVENLEAPPQAVTLYNLVNSGRVFTTRKKRLDWEVRDGRPTAEGIGVYDQSNSQSNSTVHQAYLNVGTKRIAHRFTVSRLEQANTAEMAIAELQDLLGQHMQEAMNAILEKLSAAIQVPDASTGITSLSTVLDPTAVYAGLDPAEVTKWIPIVSANGGTPRAFSRDLMIDYDATIRTYGRSYSQVWMHPLTEVRYRKLFTDLAGTYSLPNYTNVGNLKGADLGLGNATYNGKPIILEPLVPQGELRFINPSAIELFFFDLSGTLPNQPRPFDEVVNYSLGFPLRICSYPMVVPTAIDFEVYCLPQVRVRNRQNALAIKDLTTTDW